MKKKVVKAIHTKITETVDIDTLRLFNSLVSDYEETEKLVREKDEIIKEKEAIIEEYEAIIMYSGKQLDIKDEELNEIKGRHLSNIVKASYEEVFEKYEGKLDFEEELTEEEQVIEAMNRG